MLLLLVAGLGQGFRDQGRRWGRLQGGLQHEGMLWVMSPPLCVMHIMILSVATAHVQAGACINQGYPLQLMLDMAHRKT